MTTVLDRLTRTKTHLTCAAAKPLLSGSQRKRCQLVAEIYAGLVTQATAFLRAVLPSLHSVAVNRLSPGLFVPPSGPNEGPVGSVACGRATYALRRRILASLRQRVLNSSRKPSRTEQNSFPERRFRKENRPGTVSLARAKTK